MPGNSKPMGGSTSNACDQCFRTKQSCTKHPVQCARCAELGSSCTYSFGKFMGRPKRSLKSRRQFQLDAESTAQKQRETPIPLLEGPDEVQNPTLLPTPLTSDGKFIPLMPSNLKADIETFNYRFNTDDVKNQSTKGDESQKTTKKVPAPPKTSACDQCYRFKVKCTRESDCCQRCSLNGNACTYSASADLERSRKRSAPPSIESLKTKVPLLSKPDPVPNADDFGKSSPKTESHGNGNGNENFFYNAYELLAIPPTQLFTGAVDGIDKKMALSIKIGDMEFTDIGHSPSIMKAILKMEKAKAERICVELEKMAASISPCGNFSGAGKDETMVQESLIRLIEVFRGRFITEVI
ncbi:hypothetical protein EYC84_006971 [Monilinia fructicola]|uniref:Zn(2)-C6 fungal-type domain-containing protein n=1 Tax=Monilinia fructicola TaxID=38448 RepID=A0A5M9K533_MONFR|nr:hypothetical protein EYC84_006971 [Monilinia fructicola]